MGSHVTRLPHALAPGAYHREDHYALERARIFEPGWHCLGTLDDLARERDFITREVAGRPVLLTRREGAARAFANVCAHRHCLLTARPSGNAPRLRCQYHGWEYDAEGAVCNVPDARSFLPVINAEWRLPRYRVETLGRLVFVSLRPDGESLADSLGADSAALAARIFSDDHRQIIAWEREHPCNWKIPIENVLETYHVASIHRNLLSRHPELFEVFSNTVGDGQEAFTLDPRFTEFRDALGASSRAYRSVMRSLWPGARADYVHRHVFPNTVLAHTGFVSFLQVVTPVSATRSRSSVRLFLHRGAPGRRAAVAALTPALTRAAEALLGMVFREDSAVFASVQRGLECSPHAGVLGAREARVHAFQAYIAACTG